MLRLLIMKNLLYLISIILIKGCSPFESVNISEIPGKYELVTADGRQSLAISEDGSYIQKFYPIGEKFELVRNGKWELHKEKNRIEFHDFMCVDRRFSEGNLSNIESKKLDAMLILYHSKEGIKIYTDEDAGIAFKKLK